MSQSWINPPFSFQLNRVLSISISSPKCAPFQPRSYWPFQNPDACLVGLPAARIGEQAPNEVSDVVSEVSIRTHFLKFLGGLEFMVNCRCSTSDFLMSLAGELLEVPFEVVARCLCQSCKIMHCLQLVGARRGPRYAPCKKRTPDHIYYISNDGGSPLDKA